MCGVYDGAECGMCNGSVEEPVYFLLLTRALTIFASSTRNARMMLQGGGQGQ